MQSPRPEIASTISLPSCEGMLMGMVPLTTVTILSPGEPIRKLDAPIARRGFRLGAIAGAEPG